MKVATAFALVLACSAALDARPSLPQGNPPPSAQKKVGAMQSKTVTEKALADNEQKISDAVIKADLAAFKSMVATEGWSADPNGFMSVVEFEKMFKPGMAKITDMKLTGFKVLWVDDSTAVLTYTWTGKGTFNDQPVQSPSYCSTVYTKRGDNKWIAVYHQETTAAPAPAKK